jgi:hypothetical protein
VVDAGDGRVLRSERGSDRRIAQLDDLSLVGLFQLLKHLLELSLGYDQNYKIALWLSNYRYSGSLINERPLIEYYSFKEQTKII